jgi:hypothetical protein
MILFRPRHGRAKPLGLLLVTVIVLAGCASAPSEEQEGGISGTGNDVLCAKNPNDKHNPCPPRE